jgi:tetratricopeptide (TPR) repeat protein
MRRLGHSEAACNLVDQSVSLRRRLVEIRGRTPDSIGDLAFGLADGAFLFSTTSRHAESRDMLLDAAELLNQLDAAGQLKPVQARYLGVILRTLGDMSGAANAPESAKPLYLHALQHLVRAAQAAPDSTLELQNLASVAERLAECELAIGNARPAITGYLQAAELYRDVVNRSGRTPGALRALATALMSAGRTLAAAGQAPAGSPVIEESVALLREIAQRPDADDHDRAQLAAAEQILNDLRGRS